MLVEAMDPHHEFKRVYGREGFVGKRGKEIGIPASAAGRWPESIPCCIWERMSR